jgi:nucleotide-binding universal stress UspA family protein
MSPFTPQRLLLPYDFSPIGDRRLLEACQFYSAQSPRPEIFILHVLSPLPSTDPAELWQTFPLPARQHKVQQEFAHRFPALIPQPHITFQTAIGDPGHEIIHCAQTLAIDLIIMPSHGRQGWSRLLLGSVAETVIRGTHCPVLVLKDSE